MQIFFIIVPVHSWFILHLFPVYKMVFLLKAPLWNMHDPFSRFFVRWEEEQSKLFFMFSHFTWRKVKCKVSDCHFYEFQFYNYIYGGAEAATFLVNYRNLWILLLDLFFENKVSIHVSMLATQLTCKCLVHLLKRFTLVNYCMTLSYL